MEPDHISSIKELAVLAGVDSPKHPKISIHRIESLGLGSSLFPKRMTYSFYTVGLKRNLKGYVKYGRTHYDFQEGALGFAAPGQIMEFDRDLMDHATGWLLFFHKDFLEGYEIFHTLDGYGFFDYQTNEGLHLSKEEEASLELLFENIEKEYAKSLDAYGEKIILSNLELILNYSQRYYTRQFKARNKSDSSILTRFTQQLQLMYNHTPLKGLPTVEALAEKVCLSPNYLSDYLKSITGKPALEHIHEYTVMLAKNSLASTDKSISEIAFELGFGYPQYFSRLFKKSTGLTPSQFRLKFTKP